MRFEVVKKINDPNTPKICKIKSDSIDGYYHLELRQLPDIENPGNNHPAYDNYKNYISSLLVYKCISTFAKKLKDRIGDIINADEFAVKYTNGLREYDEIPDITVRLQANMSEYSWCAVEKDKRFIDKNNKPKITSELIEPRVLAFENAVKQGLSGKELEKHVKIFIDGYNAAIKNIIISGETVINKIQ